MSAQHVRKSAAALSAQALPAYFLSTKNRQKNSILCIFNFGWQKFHDRYEQRWIFGHQIHVRQPLPQLTDPPLALSLLYEYGQNPDNAAAAQALLHPLLMAKLLISFHELRLPFLSQACTVIRPSSAKTKAGHGVLGQIRALRPYLSVFPVHPEGTSLMCYPDMIEYYVWQGSGFVRGRPDPRLAVPGCCGYAQHVMHSRGQG